jgi:hypothetical protein
MTEHDRGAYTPQPDAPLQFDARSPRRRKPVPMTLIGSGAVLVVLLGALALHARHDAKPGGEPARPVGAPIAEVKTAAPATAQPKDAAAVDVFGGAAQTSQNANQSPDRAPTFAPPPETPRPRAQLTVQTAEAPPTKDALLATANAPVASPAAKASPLPSKAAPAYHAPNAAMAAASPKPDATAVVAKLAEPPMVKSATAANSPVALTSKTAPPGSAASVFEGPAVQIGAFSSMSLSEKGWTEVSSAMVGAMSGKLKRVEAVEKDGKTFYRTSVVGFPSRSAAEAFCRSLSAKGHVCFAKG